MKRRNAVAAALALLCLSCSWSSTLIVANTSGELLTIRAQFTYDLERGGTLPIEFAPVNAISDATAWTPARPAAVGVDVAARVVRVVLPPGFAARLGYASVCDGPQTCDGFPLSSLELNGRSGFLVVEGESLRAAFARESRYRWILWYPLFSAHDFRRNLGVPQGALLFVTVTMAAFALWAAVMVARTPMPRRWGWAAVALLGVGELAVNWTTGEITTSIFAFPLPGASITRSGLAGPWMIAVSFPVGAVIALLKRDRAQRMQDETASSAMPIR